MIRHEVLMLTQCCASRIMYTRHNRKDSVEGTQTQTDKTADRPEEFIDKFIKGLQYAQILLSARIAFPRL